MVTEPNVGLVICTRNRPSRVASLLEQLKSRVPTLSLVVIVDSSDSPATEAVVSALGSQSFKYLPSAPGLPFQRNVGIAYALEHWDAEVICFLDDDVEVPVDYFEKVAKGFEEHPEAACIAGFDLNLKTRSPNLFERLLFLRERNDFGKLLPSGIAIPMNNFSGILETEWAPGHSLNVGTWALKLVQFNAKIRMYGEDVEFLLRLAQVGRIYTSGNLGVFHNPEKSGRDGIAAAESYNAGFRWWLTRNYPNKFSSYKMLVSTASLMLGYLVLGLIKRDRLSLTRAKGLGLFFARLASGHQVTQTLH